MAISPSQVAAGVPSSPSGAAVGPSVPASVALARSDIADAGPGSPGPLSGAVSPGCSGAPVHGLTTPSA
jgi:hypothetical protein